VTVTLFSNSITGVLSQPPQFPAKENRGQAPIFATFMEPELPAKNVSGPFNYYGNRPISATMRFTRLHTTPYFPC